MRHCLLLLAGIGLAWLLGWAILTDIAEAIDQLPHERPAPAEKRCTCKPGACKCCGCKGP